MNNKTRLRKIVQLEQLGLDTVFVEKASRAAVEKIRNFLVNAHPLKVLTYKPVKQWHELDVTSIDQAFPDVRFDVLDNFKNAPFPTETYDVIIVPLLGFTKDGFRLGRGGGWYDKFLATQPDALKIGVGYESSLVEFEAEPHDVPMDVIVTEMEVRSEYAILHE